jgi:DNA-binding transcriptional MerR regulator
MRPGHPPARRVAVVSDHDLDPADSALVAELTTPASPDELLDLEALAERTGVSVALLEVIEREGLLLPRDVDGEQRYAASDAEALSAGLALLGAGVPLGELLDLARRYDAAMREIADEAVELFVRFVRDPIQGSEASAPAASERLVTAFREMMPATNALVAHHFRRLLLDRAQARIERDGDATEIAVARSESARALGT